VAPDHAHHTVPKFCRIQGEANPSRDSQIRFELWLPAREWNGRYYQLGNGGYAGAIPYALMAAELRRGNAVAATDTGHRSSEPFEATWARGHPEKIVDYGWRSLKVTSDAALALIHAYYGAAAHHRYFAGCSNGGRQALIAAQRFADDWDGILAGAPALDWSRQLASFAWMQHALRNDSESWISPAKLPAIQRAALDSCGPAARVVDGVPLDPRECRFDPAALKCKGEEASQCLTAKQAVALSRIQQGPRDPATGAHLYFGFEPTAAALPENWERWILNVDATAPAQLKLGEQFFRNMVFAEAEWRLADFDAARDFALAQTTQTAGQPLSRVLNATDADLTHARQRGTKLLMYFGWADALISPRAAVAYYEKTIERTGDLQKTQAFFRLFMVPGMTHCQGGPGPNAFGQSALTPGLSEDAEHDMRRALEAWVERGIAPRKIIAAKYVNDDPMQGVASTRVLCPFPQIDGC
ncbi:MAG: tannase/feruloyl esterase family alpha/beta hydrolase, partial [Steroidobacteraceae bacterium]